MKYAMLVAVVAACAPVARAEMGTWKVPSWQAFISAPDAVKKIINEKDGKCPGHSQGMCVTSNAFYFSFHNQIVKTDWKGLLLKRAAVVPHGGDICHWNGRVYVGVWEEPKVKGGKWCTVIKMYDDETLELLKEKRMPEWTKACDGITCLDGVIILGMGMKDWNGSDKGHSNYYGKFDAETLEPIGKPFLVDHGEESSCGAQNICTDGTYIYSCYYTSDGHGGASFHRTFRDEPDIERMMRTFLARRPDETIIDQWQSQILARVLLKARVIYVSACEDQIVRDLHMIPAHGAAEAMEIAKSLVGRPNYSVTVVPDGVAVIVREGTGPA